MILALFFGFPIIKSISTRISLESNKQYILNDDHGIRIRILRMSGTIIIDEQKKNDEMKKKHINVRNNKKLITNVTVIRIFSCNENEKKIVFSGIVY